MDQKSIKYIFLKCLIIVEGNQDGHIILNDIVII